MLFQDALVVITQTLKITDIHTKVCGQILQVLATLFLACDCIWDGHTQFAVRIELTVQKHQKNHNLYHLYDARDYVEK